MDKDVLQVHLTTEEKFIEKTATRVVEKLNDLNKSQTQQPSVLLTRIEVAKLLSISLPTVGNWIKQGVLKPHRMANRIYFLRDEVYNTLTKINN